MKKILLLHHCNDCGGAAVSLMYLYKMLCGDYDVSLYIPLKGSDIDAYLTANGISAKYIGMHPGILNSFSGGAPFISRTSAHNLLRIKSSCMVLRDIIKKETPDIVAVNSMTLAWVGKLVDRRKTKSVCFVRETSGDRWGMHITRRLINKYFDCSIFISEYDRKSMGFECPLKVVVRDCAFAPETMPERVFTSAFTKENPFRLLFLGGTTDFKGWDVLKNAMRQLADETVFLTVAGYAQEEKKLVSDQVKYVGVTDDVGRYMMNSDALVFPSTSAHQARPLFEAGFYSLPVILSDFKETAENAADKINVLSIKPGDARDLADKIRLFMKDAQLRKSVAGNNRELAYDRHEFSAVKNVLLDTFANM